MALKSPKVVWRGYIYNACLQVLKMTALGIETFPCNHDINAVLTGIQQHQTKDSCEIQSKNRQLMIEIVSECLKN